MLISSVSQKLDGKSSVTELLEFFQDDVCVRAVGDIFADIFKGDVAFFVDDEDGWCGYTVVVEIVDAVIAGDFVASARVEYWKCRARVYNHGSCALEIVHANGNDLRILLFDTRIVALQLDELPEAYPSEEAAVENEHDVLFVSEVGKCDVEGTVGDGEAKVWGSVPVFRWR